MVETAANSQWISAINLTINHQSHHINNKKQHNDEPTLLTNCYVRKYIQEYAQTTTQHTKGVSDGDMASNDPSASWGPTGPSHILMILPVYSLYMVHPYESLITWATFGAPLRTPVMTLLASAAPHCCPFQGSRSSAAPV